MNFELPLTRPSDSARRKLAASGVVTLNVTLSAPPPCARTPSLPSAPRVKGRIASGPASPASPTPPRIGKKLGLAITPPLANGVTRAPSTPPLANPRPTRPPSTFDRALPIPCPIGASAWFSARLDKPSASDFNTSCNRFPSTTERRNAVVIARPKPSASPCRSVSCARSGSDCAERFSKSDGMQSFPPTSMSSCPGLTRASIP